MKRAVAILLASVALAGSGLASRRVGEHRREATRMETRVAAGVARDRAVDALSLTLKSIEGRAASAAGLPPLLGILAQMRGAAIDPQLVRTLQDWFGEEPLWRSYREEFPIHGLSFGGEGLGLLVGLPTGALDTGALLRRARDKGLASAVLFSEPSAYMASAVRLAVAGLSEAPLLLLARPLDGADLAEAARRAGGAVSITGGRRTWASAGGDVQMKTLGQVAGRQAEGTIDDVSGEWSAAAAEIGIGIWLWSYAGAAPSDSATGAAAAIWGIGISIAILMLFVGFRRTSLPDLPSGAPSQTKVGLASTAYAASSPAVILPASTRTFGRYTLLEKLGEGGMSRVYTAVIFGAEGFRRKFVVKRLRPELVGDAAVVSQFIDEANMASSLIHSNIVPVLDFGKLGDEYFMATEYILGRDAGRVAAVFMAREGRGLPVDVVLTIAHATLEALAYAHTKTGEGGQPLGIVHRDVSPANILVSARGEVKLFDFGIVKAQGRVTKTEAGVVKGNVSFMSPEQARGLDTDARSDLFSMGLVMYYLLTGEVLYQGNTSFDLLVKAAEGPNAGELALVRALPAPAAELAAKALAVDPNQRYVNATAFAAAIAPLVSRTGGQLAALMDGLFAAEFEAEEKRFSASVPAAASESMGT